MYRVSVVGVTGSGKTTFKRVAFRHQLWSSNRESLWIHFFTRDSLFLWLFQTYWRRKREYPMLFALPEHAHLRVVHLQSTEEAEGWILCLMRALAAKSIPKILDAT